MKELTDLMENLSISRQTCPRDTEDVIMEDVEENPGGSNFSDEEPMDWETTDNVGSTQAEVGTTTSITLAFTLYICFKYGFK